VKRWERQEILRFGIKTLRKKHPNPSKLIKEWRSFHCNTLIRQVGNLGAIYLKNKLNTP
jgi:hypothetical protein